MITKAALRMDAVTRRSTLARGCPDFAQRIAAFAADLKIAPRAIVSGYWPIGDEADPRGLMMVLAGRGHPLALPRISAKASPLVFHHWYLGSALVAHRFGMSEPPASADVLVPDVLLLPLLAFDAHGYRLGYGGGFYDRTLALLCTGKNVRAIGIAYAGQESDTLPVDGHDRALDAIITENGVRNFSPM